MIFDGIGNKKVFKEKINNKLISKALKLNNDNSNLELLNILESNVYFSVLKNLIFPIISTENRVLNQIR